MMRSPPPSYEQSVIAEDLTDTTLAHVSEKMALLQSDSDVEAAAPYRPSTDDPSSGKHAAEYQIPARVKYSYLAVYFSLNLGLTLFNKIILGKVGNPRAEQYSITDT